MTLVPGQIIEEFKIIRQIGEGGFSAVYLAFDLVNNRQIAIKELRNPSLYHDTILRFTQEAEIIRSLAHPNIVRFYGVREWNDYNYLILEYISGGSLRDYIERGYKFSTDEVSQIGEEICGALMQVHRLGVVHRDIKPANILLDEQGLAKITDFGISYKPVVVGGYSFDETHQPGTLIYMSPQQVQNILVDRLTDIYAVGVVLYELVTGTPYIDTTSLEIQANLRAKQEGTSYPNIFFQLIVDEIIKNEKPNIREYQPSVPEWLEGCIEAAIGQRISLRALHYSLKNRCDYFSFGTGLSELNIKINNLYPILRPKLNEYRALNKQLGIESVMEVIVNREWNVFPEIYIYIGVDSEDSITYLQKNHLNELELDLDQVIDISFSNLQSMTKKIKPECITEPSGRVIGCSYNVGDGYDASRVLLRDVRLEICNLLKSDLCVIGIPDRDLLIACLPNRDQIVDFQKIISQECVTREHPITDRLFFIDKSGGINLAKGGW